MQLTFPKYGFTADDAYLKVSTMQVIDTPVGWIATFNLKIYFDAAAKTSGKAPVEEVYHTMNYGSSSSAQDQYNVVKQAYEYLKTLSQFSTAVDV